MGRASSERSRGLLSITTPLPYPTWSALHSSREGTFAQRRLVVKKMAPPIGPVVHVRNTDPKEDPQDWEESKHLVGRTGLLGGHLVPTWLSPAAPSAHMQLTLKLQTGGASAQDAGFPSSYSRLSRGNETGKDIHEHTWSQQKELFSQLHTSCIYIFNFPNSK